MRATLIKVTIGIVLLGLTMILAAAVGHKATLEQRAYTQAGSSPIVVTADHTSQDTIEMDADVAKIRKQLDQQTTNTALEDETGFSCARNGNRICGPTNNEGAQAGCYRNGELVIPWTRYDVPSADPLWAQKNAPC